MDANKLEKLREIEYTISKGCALCSWGSFGHGQVFGCCRLHKYRHLKHDNPNDGAFLSVHRCGSCPQFELDQAKQGPMLGKWREFLK